MNAGRIADLADHQVLGKIDNAHFRRVREIEAARRGIDGHIIPAAFTTDRDFVEKFIGFYGSNRFA